MQNWDQKRKDKISGIKQELDEETANDRSFAPSLSPMRKKIFNNYPPELCDNYGRKRALARYYDRMTKAKDLKTEKEIRIGNPYSSLFIIIRTHGKTSLQVTSTEYDKHEYQLFKNAKHNN